MPAIGHELSVEQELACALRVLAREGWEENLAGHITVALDDGSLLVNPWGKWWHEVRASDVVRIDGDGTVLAGRWDVTPAVFLHTELHRARPDARVVVHNHPYHATLLACCGRLPEIAHQNSALLAGDMVFVDEYDGTVETVGAGRWLADRVGGPVWLKCENLQRAGSFKVRGAYLRLHRMSPEERARGVVTASAGNHAQEIGRAHV